MSGYDHQLEQSAKDELAEEAERQRQEWIDRRVVELVQTRLSVQALVQEALETAQSNDHEQFFAFHLSTFFLSTEKAQTEKELADSALKLVALLRPGIKEALTDDAKTDAATEYDNQQRNSADMRDERRAA